MPYYDTWSITKSNRAEQDGVYHGQPHSYSWTISLCTPRPSCWQTVETVSVSWTLLAAALRNVADGFPPGKAQLHVLEGLSYEFYTSSNAEQHWAQLCCLHDYTTVLQSSKTFPIQVTLILYLLAALVPEVLVRFFLWDTSFLPPATTWTLEQDTSTPQQPGTLEGTAQDLWTVLYSVYMCEQVRGERVMLACLFV